MPLQVLRVWLCGRSPLWRIETQTAAAAFPLCAAFQLLLVGRIKCNTVAVQVASSTSASGGAIAVSISKRHYLVQALREPPPWGW